MAVVEPGWAGGQWAGLLRAQLGRGCKRNEWPRRSVLSQPAGRQRHWHDASASASASGYAAHPPTRSPTWCAMPVPAVAAVRVSG